MDSQSKVTVSRSQQNVMNPRGVSIDTSRQAITINVYDNQSHWPCHELRLFPDESIVSDRLMHFYQKLSRLPTTEEELDNLSYKIVEKDEG